MLNQTNKGIRHERTSWRSHPAAALLKASLKLLIDQQDMLALARDTVSSYHVQIRATPSMIISQLIGSACDLVICKPTQLRHQFYMSVPMCEIVNVIMDWLTPTHIGDKHYKRKIVLCVNVVCPTVQLFSSWADKEHISFIFHGLSIRNLIFFFYCCHLWAGRKQLQLSSV